MHSEAASKSSDVVRRGITLHDCLQQVEKYDSDSSSVRSEEAAGDDQEEEDGTCLVSAHYARAAADVPGLCLCTTGSAPCLVEHCLCCCQRVGRNLLVVVMVRIVSAHS